MKQKSFNGDVIYASVLQKMITKERANQNASIERLLPCCFALKVCFLIFLGTTVLPNLNVVCSTLGRLRSTQPSHYHTLSQQRGLSKKKKMTFRPIWDLNP